MRAAECTCRRGRESTRALPGLRSRRLPGSGERCVMSRTVIVYGFVSRVVYARLRADTREGETETIGETITHRDQMERARAAEGWSSAALRLRGIRPPGSFHGLFSRGCRCCARCAAVRRVRLSRRDLRSVPAVLARSASGARLRRRPGGSRPVPLRSAAGGAGGAHCRFPYRPSPLPFPVLDGQCQSWGITPFRSARRVPYRLPSFLSFHRESRSFPMQ
jgi:hypothetical protein